MWLINTLTTFQRELVLGAAFGLLVGFGLRIIWAQIEAGAKSPVTQRVLRELDEPATFVRLGIAFGMFMAAHMVLEAIAGRKSPLSSAEGLLIYLLFLGGAYTLVMGLRNALLRLARRVVEAEQGKATPTS